MQLADAEHRLRILRERLQSRQTGEDVSLQVDHDQVLPATVTDGGDGSTEWGKRERGQKKRRRGDDDDDEFPVPKPAGVATMKHTSSDAPLMGADGHINLFPPEGAAQKSTGNKEFMADKKRKEDELEAQYTMKLSRPSEPWYSAADGVAEADKAKDENRRKREDRVETRAREENDPMNVMKKGVGRLREARGEVAVERRKRDAEVGIGLSRDVEGLSRRRDHGHNYRHRHGDNNDRRHGDDDRRHRDDGRDGRDCRDYRDYRNDRGERHHRSRQSRSPKDERRRVRSRSREKRKDDNGMAKMREEKLAREAAERRKAQALVEEEMGFRKPEKWMASAAGGRGKYSRQFGE